MPENVRGVDAVKDRLRKVGARQRLEDALDKAAAIVEADAVRAMPFDSGLMASRMYVSKPSSLERKVGNDSPEALFTEYSHALTKGGTPQVPREGPWPYLRDGVMKGTKGSATMPWLRPALWKNRERIKDLLKKAVSGR